MLSTLGLLTSLFACDVKQDATTTDTSTSTSSDSTYDSASPLDTGADGSWEARFDVLAATLESERLTLGAPGLAAAVLEGDEVAFAIGLGDRLPDGTGGPVGPETLFRIGSITKALTATALLQQVDAGHFSLSDPLSAVMPDLHYALGETWADEILVRHTLTNEGGYYDYLEIDRGSDDELLDEVVAGAMADNLMLIASPGVMWNYANPNFYMAGLLTERVDGRFYREVLAEDLFAPLGMERTFFLGEEVLADGDYASGSTVNWNTGVGEVLSGPDSYDNGWARPAGYAWSSVLDLAKFVQFLMRGDGAVLDDSLRQAMSTPQVDVQYGVGLGYGYGLFVQEGFFLGDDWYAVPIVAHGGDLPGFAADLYYLPEQEVGFVVLASADAAHVNDSLMAWLETVALPAPSEPPDWSVDPADFPEFVGAYVEPWGISGDFEVALDGDTLTVDFPLLNRTDFPYEAELVPYTPDNFFFNLGGFEMLLTFIRGDSGAVEYARTRLFVGTRAETADATRASFAGGDLARLTAGLRALEPEFLKTLGKKAVARPYSAGVKPAEEEHHVDDPEHHRAGGL